MEHKYSSFLKEQIRERSEITLECLSLSLSHFLFKWQHRCKGNMRASYSGRLCSPEVQGLQEADLWHGRQGVFLTRLCFLTPLLTRFCRSLSGTHPSEQSVVEWKGPRSGFVSGWPPSTWHSLVCSKAMFLRSFSPFEDLGSYDQTSK